MTYNKEHWDIERGIACVRCIIKDINETSSKSTEIELICNINL
jgi:hypothetical protein